MDLFTTLLNLTGLKAPNDRVIDGLDLSGSLVRGEEFERPVFFYRGNTLFAVRFGPYKMHLWTWTTPQSELDLVSPSYFLFASFGCCYNTNKTGLQPVSRPVEQPLLGFRTVKKGAKK